MMSSVFYGVLLNIYAMRIATQYNCATVCNVKYKTVDHLNQGVPFISVSKYGNLFRYFYLYKYQNF